MSEKQQSTLQLEPDLAHERLEWRVQRVGWATLAIICVAALAGLLGPGPLSQKHSGKIGSELYVEYERYIRNHAPYALRVFCRPGDGRDAFTLALDRGWIQNVIVEHIHPEPAFTTSAGGRYLFHFKSSEGDEQLVTFHFQPNVFGNLSGSLSLDGKHTINIKQFVWP